MNPADVVLCFKGNRTYLRGADLYACAVTTARQTWPDLDGRCRLTFHRLPRKPLTLWTGMFADTHKRPDGCVAEMHVTGNDPQVSLWFTERAGDVECRFAYDEDAVIRDCAISGQRIAMTHVPDATAIDVLVAMTKRLHYALLPPRQGWWLLSRLDLRRFLREDDRRGMAVEMVNAARPTLTRCEVTRDGEPLGSVFFSLVAV